MQRKIEETPESIVGNGRIRTGVFRTPVRNMNFSEADVFGGPAMQTLWKYRLKEWIGYGIIHPEWYITVFIQDAKFVSSAAIFAFNRTTGKNERWSHAGFLNGVRMCETQWNGRTVYKKRGFEVEYHHNLDASEHRILVNVKGGRRRPAIDADIVLTEDLRKVQPLVVSLPLVRKFNNIYTHKAPMPAGGWVKIGDEEIVFDAGRDIAIMDEHRSFLPYKTVWRWATFAGRDANGKVIGLNIGDHDTINNGRQWNENCIWAGNEMSLLGPGEFDYPASGRMRPWKILETDGRADVVFYPEHKNVENHSIGLIKMKYFQMCGRFSGFLIDDNGARHEVNDYYGVAEVMDSRW